jgi:ferric-dicitrate binding protein FerR (iron transport regulator)
LVLGLLGYGVWRQLGPGGDVPASPSSKDTAVTVRFLTGAVGVRATPVPRLRIGDRLTAGAVIETGSSGRGAVTLADQVEVRLDAGSALQIDGDRQFTVLAGAIYVDTTTRQGPPTPIEVRARGVLMQDIGTQFEVRVLDDDVRVRVRDGRVQVRRGGDIRTAHAATEVLVTATSLREAAARPYGEAWSWTLQATPPPVVDGRPLSDFLAWVRRESGRTVRFADPALERATADATVYGSVDGASVEEALEIVLPSCGLAHRIDRNIITLVDATDVPGRR